MTKIYKKKCPICKKKIESLSKSQAEYNFYIHVNACRRKIKMEEKQNDNNQEID